ncbi:hypothetical protein M885DRAFT_615556 [Pelagophyceae sp. CCMP2097]|nr:hypothetical protein M885DRAFT_615556 [Pelagophyceae sp. CCMP2097]
MSKRLADAAPTEAKRARADGPPKSGALSSSDIAALQGSNDVFLELPRGILTDDHVVAAIHATANPNLDTFGLNGSGSVFGAAACAALGGVCASTLDLSHFFTASDDGLIALLKAISANKRLRKIIADSTFAPTLRFALSAHKGRIDVVLPLPREEGDDDSEDDDDSDSEEGIECDGAACGALLVDDDVVWTTIVDDPDIKGDATGEGDGQEGDSTAGCEEPAHDYCAACAATAIQAGASLRQTTARGRMEECAQSGLDGDDSEGDDDDDDDADGEHDNDGAAGSTDVVEVP